MQPLIQTALLGTAKQPLKSESLPEALQTAWQQLPHENAENRLWRFSAAAFAYHYGAQMPAPKTAEWKTLPAVAETTESPVLSPTVGQFLADWFLSDNLHLYRFGLQTLAKANFRLAPTYQPDFYHFLQKRPEYHAEFADTSLFCPRFKWLLAQLNPSQTTNEESDWTLGNFSERKQWLRRQRQLSPEFALQQLQLIWKTAPANHRADYVEILTENLSPADQDFLLEAFQTDRSSTVRDVTRTLLEKLPNSPVSLQYQQWLGERLSYVKTESSGGLLNKLAQAVGFGGKSANWQYQPKPFEAEMKRYGLQELSSEKGESDADFLLRQLMVKVPLSFWANLCGVSEQEAVEILLASPPISQNVDWETWALTLGSLKFTQHLIAKDLAPYLFFGALSAAEREDFLQQHRFSPKPADEAWHQILNEEWGEKTSELAVRSLAKRPHYFTQETVEQIAICLYPSEKIKKQLEYYAEERTVAETMIRIFNQKYQFLHAIGQHNE